LDRLQSLPGILDELTTLWKLYVTKNEFRGECRYGNRTISGWICKPKAFRNWTGSLGTKAHLNVMKN